MNRRQLFSVVDTMPTYTKVEYVDSKTGELLDEQSETSKEYISTYDDVEQLFYNPITQTEQAGYKPPRLQVMDLLIAGERLVASERERYYQSQDLTAEEREIMLQTNDLELPEFRKQGYDAVDAWKAMKDYNKKLETLNQLVQERKRQSEEYEQKLYSEFKAQKQAQIDEFNKNIGKDTQTTISPQNEAKTTKK